jgi:AcrR family transcriptional regulator
MSIEKLDTQIRQNQIAQAALDLVSSQGMKGLSVAAVARKVGVVPSAIYRHFKGKDHVLDAVLDLISHRLIGNVMAVREETADPMERLRLLLARHAHLIRDNQAIPRVVFSDEVYGGNPGRKARMHGIVSTYLSSVGDIVRDGQERRMIRNDVDPGAIAVMFLGLIQTPAILWHLSGENFDVSKQIERAWKIFRETIEKS